MKKSKHVHLIVHGRVQSVGFRYYIWQMALTKQIKGWVRNTPSQTVEVRAEGPEESVNAFLELAKKGSPLSRVDKVEIAASEKLEHFKTFEIRN